MDRITDRHDMTSAVDHGHKASTQNRRDPVGQRKPGMKCGWMTGKSLIGMDSADPQNRSKWRGRLRGRLVKQAQPLVEENRL